MEVAKSKITEVIISRLESLKTLKEETIPIGHSSSMGHVREARLAALLRSYIPNDIGIESGFICDGIGAISPQIDIIITDNDPIPTLDFDNLFKLIPVEKVICCIEVKSTLKTDDLEQIKNQVEAINKMARCVGQSSSDQRQILPVMFSAFALECSVSKPTISTFLSSNLEIRQVSVVGSYGVRNSDWNTPTIEECPGDSKFIETRRSIAWLLHLISQIKEYRLENFPMAARREAWEAYLGSDTLVVS